MRFDKYLNLGGWEQEHMGKECKKQSLCQARRGTEKEDGNSKGHVLVYEKVGEIEKLCLSLLGWFSLTENEFREP